MNHLTAAKARAFAEKWLLASNPNWAWSQLEGIPMQDGVLNKWLARIPVGPRTLEILGV